MSRILNQVVPENHLTHCGLNGPNVYIVTTKPNVKHNFVIMPSAIVVGGGLSGLSAAHTLIQSGVQVTLLRKILFLGGNSTKATSGINGAGSRTQSKMGINDGVDQFLEDTVRSATGVKTGPMPTPYPLARLLRKQRRRSALDSR